MWEAQAASLGLSYPDKMLSGEAETAMADLAVKYYNGELSEQEFQEQANEVKKNNPDQAQAIQDAYNYITSDTSGADRSTTGDVTNVNSDIR
jgi:lipoprotein NlpI